MACIAFAPPFSVALETPGPPFDSDDSVLDAAQKRVVEELQVQLNTTVYRLLLVAPDAEEFRRLRVELFQRYVALSTSIGKLYKTDLTQDQFADFLAGGYQIVTDAISSDTFLLTSESDRDDAASSIDAMARAHALLTQYCAGLTVEEAARAELSKLMEGVSLILFTAMHLHAVLYAISHRIGPPSEIVAELLIGMRHAANAYADIREVWGSRFELLEQSEV